MSKQKKKPLIPKLRFPEFQNAGEWDTKALDSLAKRITKKNTNGSISRVLTNSAVNGVVDQRDYFDKDIANQNNLYNYYIVDVGDYVYNPRVSVTAPVGPISKNKIGKGVMSPLYTVFRFNNHDNDFYEQYFNTACWHMYLHDISNTGARHDRMSLTNDDFMNMPLPYPSLPEQQKIADCLTSLDELITAESDKLEAYKAHKKGLMQKLFPAEGKTVPEWRFPEFRYKGEWEIFSLGNKTTKVGSGITPKGGANNYKSKGRPFIRSQNIGWGYMILEDVAFIDDATHSTFNATEIKEADVFLNITGASIGRSAVADSRVQGGNVNQHVCIIRTKNSELSPNFLNQYLLSQYGQEQINNFQAGGNRQGLNFAHVRSISIPLPSTKCEQQRIVDCLCSYDELNIAQAQKIEALKMYKKGLMQGLFPSIDKVEV